MVADLSPATEEAEVLLGLSFYRLKPGLDIG
jgi:hypothetical protein